MFLRDSHTLPYTCLESVVNPSSSTHPVTSIRNIFACHMWLLFAWAFPFAHIYCNTDAISLISPCALLCSHTSDYVQKGMFFLVTQMAWLQVWGYILMPLQAGVCMGITNCMMIFWPSVFPWKIILTGKTYRNKLLKKKVSQHAELRVLNTGSACLVPKLKRRHLPHMINTKLQVNAICLVW